MGSLLQFPARPFPKPAPVAPAAPVEPASHRELRLVIAELKASHYRHTADRVEHFFEQYQTGPLALRPSALGAAFSELASLSSDKDHGPTARYAALLLIALAFPTTSPGAA